MKVRWSSRLDEGFTAAGVSVGVRDGRVESGECGAL